MAELALNVMVAQFAGITLNLASTNTLHLTENDDVTNHPTTAQSLTDSWTNTAGVIEGTFTGGNVFTADGNWGTINQITLYINSATHSVRIPLDVARALLTNYELTISGVDITVT